MCLNQVNKVYDGKSKKIVYRWKTFTDMMSDGRLQFPYYTKEEYKVGIWDIKRGVWLKAIPEKVFVGRSYPSYEAGFHCYQTKKEATRRCTKIERVVKVKVKGLLAKGIQTRCRVEVYMEMMVPKSLKGDNNGLRVSKG